MTNYKMILRLSTAIVGVVCSVIMMIGIIYYHLNSEISDMLDMHISRYTIVIMYLFAALFLIGGIISFLSFLKIYRNRRN